VAEESQPTIPNGRIREASPELGEPVQPATAARKPRQRKAAKRNLDQTIGGDDIVQSIEETGPKPKRTRSASAVPRKSRSTSTADSDEPKRRRKRNETPEDAEDQEIDHATTKMSDLTRDLKIGKKFSKHEEIKQRDLERKVRAKARRENPELVDESEDERRPRQVREVEMEVPADPSNGPRMRLVDGQIVIDETSLVVDRHKIAAQNAGVMEIVEEDDFTRITTQATFMKREKNIAWDFEAEELFYTGLRMFGTDFEMISKMFPSRSRRQIKLKFNREERLYPDKINRTLIGEKVPINFDEYKTHTGLEYEDVSAINAEREAVAAEQRAEEEKVEAELAEQTRQKKAAIHGIGGSEKENEDGGSSKRKSKRSKRNMHSINGGGEEVEILGDI
jgi:transcription factor TFIIIB component B''